MVKELTRYECEFETCGARYDSRERAQKCEDYGFIGPDIRRGFIFSHRNNDDLRSKYYHISLGTSMEGHHRICDYRTIDGDLKRLNRNEKYFNSLDEEGQKRQLQDIDMMDIDHTTTKEMQRYLIHGFYRILPVKEFREVSKFIHNANCMKPYRSPWYVGFKQRFHRMPSIEDILTIPK